ncbi:copper transport protein [Azospirillum soli]|nr:copper transport protein [Azospirillum soli]
MRRRIVGLLAVLLLLAGTPVAWAHAVLVESVPADGARLDHPPAEIRLRFNEPVQPVSVRVLGPGGQALPLPGPTKAENGTVIVPLPPELTAGTHVVSYRVSSGDGHPVAGSLLFGIGAPPDRSAVHGEQAREATVLAAALGRALHYGSLLIAAGGGLFLALVLGRWSPVNGRLKPGLCLTIGVAAMAVVLNVGLAGAVLEGAPLGALAGASVWKTGVTSTSGFSGVVALLSLIVVALGLALEGRGRTGTVLLVGGAVGASLALTATGHAATAEPRWLSVPLVAVHGFAAAFWVGSLWPLAVVLRTETAKETARIVRRFSGIAIGAVAALLLAGTGLSVLQLAEPRAVVDSAYGQIWLGKMVCVAVLLGLACFNRLRLTPGLDSAGTAGRLRGSVFTEMVVAGLILLFTAAMGTTPPPRARAVSDVEASYTAAIVSKGRQAVVTITPARSGPNRIEVHLTQVDGSPLSVKEVTIQAALPSAGIEPLERALGSAGPGLYAADGVELPAAGAWAVRLDVLVSDFEKALFRTEVPVGDVPLSLPLPLPPGAGEGIRWAAPPHPRRGRRCGRAGRGSGRVRRRDAGPGRRCRLPERR